MKYLVRTFFVLLCITIPPHQAFAATIDVDTTTNEANPISGIVDVVDGESPPTIVDVAEGLHIVDLLRLWGSSVVNFNNGEIRWSGVEVLEDDSYVIQLFDSSQFNVSSGSRLSGEALNANGQSVVNFEGGRNRLDVVLSDSSTLNVSGSSFDEALVVADDLTTVNIFRVRSNSSVSADGSSTVTIFRGVISTDEPTAVRAKGLSVVNIHGGRISTAEGSGLSSSDSSTVNIYGGSIVGLGADDIFVAGSSIANVYGGVFRELEVRDEAVVNFFGMDLAMADGVLTGESASGTDFNVRLDIRGNAQVVLHEVPEPSGIVLMSFGCGLLSLLRLSRFRLFSRERESSYAEMSISSEYEQIDKATPSIVFGKVPHPHAFTPSHEN